MGEKTNTNFLKHFIIIGGGTALNLLIGLITTPLITRMVDPTAYGQLSIFSMYENIAVMILCMGLDQALVRYFYEKDDVTYKRALLEKCIKLPLILCMVVSIFVMSFSLTNTFSFEFTSGIMLLFCLYSLFGVLYRFSQLIVRLSYQSKLYSALNILQKTLYIGISIPLIFYIKDKHFSLLAFSTTVSYGVCMVVSILAQIDIWDFRKNKPIECNIRQRELFMYAYPYIFSSGITTLFQALDKISLNYYCSYAEVGVYSSAMTLVHIFAIIQTTFNSLWTPMSVEHYTKNREDKSFYQKGNQVITVIMFFLGMSLILCKDIFAILLGEKYREAACILPFLIFNPIMYTISETTVSGLVFMKKSKLQVVVAIGACTINLIGNTLLVPELGCQGAAISTGISYIAFFSLRTFWANKYFKVDFGLKKFYFLTTIVCIYALYNTFVKFDILSIIGYCLCLGVLILLYRDTFCWGINYLKIYLEKKWRSYVQN